MSDTPQPKQTPREPASDNASVPLLHDSPSVSEAAQRSNPDQLVGIAVQQTSFSGPLPPPEILAQYEQILPGAADRLFMMAERQAAHRMELETTVVKGNVLAQHRGVLGAVTTVVAGFGLSGCLAFFGIRRPCTCPGFYVYISRFHCFHYRPQIKAPDTQNPPRKKLPSEDKT